MLTVALPVRVSPNLCCLVWMRGPEQCCDRVKMEVEARRGPALPVLTGV